MGGRKEGGGVKIGSRGWYQPQTTLTSVHTCFQMIFTSVFESNLTLGEWTGEHGLYALDEFVEGDVFHLVHGLVMWGITSVEVHKKGHLVFHLCFDDLWISDIHPLMADIRKGEGQVGEMFAWFGEILEGKGMWKEFNAIIQAKLIGDPPLTRDLQEIVDFERRRGTSVGAMKKMMEKVVKTASLRLIKDSLPSIVAPFTA